MAIKLKSQIGQRGYPIILSIPEAQILQFKDGEITQVKYTETEHYQLTRQFLKNPDVYLKEL